MTVYELIQELAQFDADMEVEVSVSADGLRRRLWQRKMLNMEMP